MNQPLVSICIPTYNGEKFIEQALQSAINQTYKNIEMIISDDNSVDNTLAIVKETLINSSIPFYIFNHEPKGIGANWNNCIEKANGVYIKFLFQDDLLQFDCIEKMIELALSDNNIGLIYCKRTILYDRNNADHTKWIRYCGTLHTKWHKIKVQQGVLEGKKYLSDLYLMNGPLNKIGEPTAVLIRKDCFDRVGYFDESLKQTLDIEYWYRLMKYYKVGFIDEELVSFRLHDEQATFVNQHNKVDEKYLLNKKKYNSIFWHLHLKNKWKLFKSHSRIGDVVRYIKRIAHTY
ncbi:MAG: hypothetical protein B7Y83_03695 [Flavobacteriales bacterium 32-34-25]|nr:MAG: hypothetical protein B7Y83_03695 [Flavobacteriales bacterium 32-34-25]